MAHVSGAVSGKRLTPSHTLSLSLSHTHTHTHSPSVHLPPTVLLPTTPLAGDVRLPSTYGSAPWAQDTAPLSLTSMLLYNASALRTFTPTGASWRAPSGTPVAGRPLLTPASTATLAAPLASQAALTLALQGLTGTGDRLAIIPSTGQCSAVV